MSFHHAPHLKTTPSRTDIAATLRNVVMPLDRKVASPTLNSTTPHRSSLSNGTPTIRTAAIPRNNNVNVTPPSKVDDRSPVTTVTPDLTSLKASFSSVQSDVKTPTQRPRQTSTKKDANTPIMVRRAIDARNNMRDFIALTADEVTKREAIVYSEEFDRKDLWYTTRSAMTAIQRREREVQSPKPRVVETIKGLSNGPSPRPHVERLEAPKGPSPLSASPKVPMKREAPTTDIHKPRATSLSKTVSNAPIGLRQTVALPKANAAPPKGDDLATSTELSSSVSRRTADDDEATSSDEEVRTQATRQRAIDEDLINTLTSSPIPAPSSPVVATTNLGELGNILSGFDQPPTKRKFSVPLPPPKHQDPTTTSVMIGRRRLSDDTEAAGSPHAFGADLERANKRVSWNPANHPDHLTRLSSKMAKMEGDEYEFFHSDMSSDRDQNDADKLRIVGLSRPAPLEMTDALMQSARNAFKFQETKARAFLGCKVTLRLKVTLVHEGGAAAAADIRVGDVLIGSELQTFKKGQDFVTYVSELCAGDKITLRVQRGVSGEILSLPVCVGAIPIALSASDQEARNTYLDILREHKTTLTEETCVALETILHDRDRYVRFARRSFDIVDCDAKGRITHHMFRSVIQVFSNAIGMNRPLEESVDVAFLLADSHKTGFLSLQETTDAMHSFYTDLVANYKPQNNPLMMLSKAKAAAANDR